MKTSNKLVSFLIILSVICSISSCRTELDEETETLDHQNLRANSLIANLILKTTMNDGSTDNFIDGTSCFKISLPVNVNIDGTIITLNTEEDFEEIQNVFDEVDQVTDDLSFIFPISVIQSDFSEIYIENEEQLDEITKNCITNDIDDDIECVDFQYPFDISTFNEVTELIETVTFSGDQELYNFINNLDTFDIVNIRFPINMTLSDGSEIEINNLETLENTIEDAADDCDENDLSEAYFVDIFVSAPLEVQKYKDNQSNETKNYEGYVFNFSDDGTVTVTLNDEITTGTWFLITQLDGTLDAVFDFGDETPLNKLNNNWGVKQIQEKRIMLDDRVEDEISKDELFFDQI